jgi:MFS family permease
MLSRIYPKAYTSSSAQANVASITFAGTVVGMLFFGYTSDHFSRKWSLFASTIIIILFAALGTGSYGAGGSPTGLLAALVAYRFFLGIGESAQESFVKCLGTNLNRNRRRIPSR